MFTQAEYNPRARKLHVLALISREKFRDWRAAELIEFVGGDLAWYGGRGRYSWGTCSDLGFRQFISISWNDFNPYRAAYCDVDTRKEYPEGSKSKWKEINGDQARAEG